MNDFWAMGGYAAYVWPSYALALAVLVYNLWSPVQRQRQIFREIARKQRRLRKPHESDS
jgi:heme exporter protein D